MKRIAMVCALMLIVAGSASAATYLWNVNATDTTNSNYGAYARFGVRTAANSIDQTYDTSNAAYAAVLSYTGDLGGSAVKTKLDYTKYVVGTDPAKWILQVWTGTQYAMESMDIRVWATTSAANNPLAGWRLFKLYDPITGVWGRTELTSADIAGTTSGTQASPWFKVNLPVSGNAKTSTPLDAGKGYVLELSKPIPEPGSMVAMLSGLVGLVGFGIRRRR